MLAKVFIILSTLGFIAILAGSLTIPVVSNIACTDAYAAPEPSILAVLSLTGIGFALKRLIKRKY
jgi:hypothetical protein